MEKVILGLSGGVDSAVAAKLLQQQGYTVIGLYLDFGYASLEDAKQVAKSIGIEFVSADCRTELQERVCAYFGNEYRNARTPNPCVVCNRILKFKTLLEYADRLGAKYVATGHYARIKRDAQGRALLCQALSPKDQSYMLANLSRDILERCIFPLGEAADKQEVRALAKENDIPVAQKKDSMDVCFIPDGDCGGWLERNGYALPQGNFVAEDGKVLGQHQGLHKYTVGQRKGLGVAASGRLFVHELRKDSNEVVLSLNDVFRNQISLTQVNLCAPEYVHDGMFSCQIRVRYSKSSANAIVMLHDGNCANVTFETSVRAPSAGQFAVFYDGEIVIGGGFIQ